MRTTTTNHIDEQLAASVSAEIAETALLLEQAAHREEERKKAVHSAGKRSLFRRMTQT